MSADGHMMLFGQGDGITHHRRVTGMKAARQIRGRDGRNNGLIFAVGVDPQAFAHVGVDVDLFGGQRFGSWW